MTYYCTVFHEIKTISQTSSDILTMDF